MSDSDFHYTFLAACLGDGSQWASNEGSTANISPTALIRTADAQFVLPAVHSALQNRGLSWRLPAEANEFLSTLELLNLERNRMLLSEIKSIAELLNRHGIEPILLKGAAYLVAGVYQHLADRLIGDIDLLIAKSQYPAAIELLVNSGYRRAESDPVGLFRHHHPPLRRPHSALVEVHRSLTSGKLAHFLTGSEIVAFSSAHELEGVRVRIPSPEHLVTHHILHSQLHGYYSERIWPSLRCMLDLLLLERRFGSLIDWPAVATRFRRNHQYRALALHLNQVEQTLGMPTPIAINWTPAVKLHRFNRELIRAHPSLRLIDPDLYASMLGRRARIVGSILSAPTGWKVLSKALFGARFYRNLLDDLRKGIA
jgi:hypothetical protein